MGQSFEAFRLHFNITYNIEGFRERIIGAELTIQHEKYKGFFENGIKFIITSFEIIVYGNIKINGIKENGEQTYFILTQSMGPGYKIKIE